MEMFFTYLASAIKPVPCDGCPDNLFIVFRDISNVILGCVSIIAIIMLIIGGIRYMISGGNSKKITDAKNTILYAIIGLVICLLSTIIVNTVITTIPSGEIDEPDTTSFVDSVCG